MSDMEYMIGRIEVLAVKVEELEGVKKENRILYEENQDLKKRLAGCVNCGKNGEILMREIVRLENEIKGD